MGFYPPDSLAHEAQRRGIELLPVDINRSGEECSVERVGAGGASGAVRIGLGYVKGLREQERAVLLRARSEGGPFASVADLAARAGVSRGALEQLAWAGACDPLAGDRRTALWQLGIAAAGETLAAGTQLALALDTGVTPALRELARWERLLADYETSGVTVSDHALAILRPRLTGVATSVQLGQLRHGVAVSVAGLVVARQRPETAGGVVFMLLEDEFGAINLIVPPPVYESHRHLVRAEPLVLAHGRLERPAAGGGAINVLVRSLQALALDERPPTLVSQLHPVDARAPGSGAADADLDPDELAAGLRAVAPPVQSFASGRRR